MSKPHKKPATQPPARQKVTYAAVPIRYVPLLDGLRKAGARHQGRSRAFLVQMALDQFLQAEAALDANGKPKTG